MLDEFTVPEATRCKKGHSVRLPPCIRAEFGRSLCMFYNIAHPVNDVDCLEVRCRYDEALLYRRTVHSTLVCLHRDREPSISAQGQQEARLGAIGAPRGPL